MAGGTRPGPPGPCKCDGTGRGSHGGGKHTGRSCDSSKSARASASVRVSEGREDRSLTVAAREEGAAGPRGKPPLLIFFAFLAIVCLFPEIWLKGSYSEQHRELIGTGPSVHFPLGTDELGRDRFVRLLYAARTSLLLAAAAALLSSLIAAIVGCAAGWIGGWTERIIVSGVDLFVWLPWLFSLLTVRAVLPLAGSPRPTGPTTLLL